MNLIRVTMVVASLLAASSAWAQGVYVGGAVGAEAVRTSTTESGGITYDNGSGDAFAGAIRVGTFLTNHVGLELEYFRPGEIETDGGGPIYLADDPVLAYSFTDGRFGDLGIPSLPAIISQSVRVRTSTMSALLTARQSLSGRVELVYLGGVGFSRVVHEVEYGFPRGILPVAPAIQRSFSSRTTQYAAGPVVGIEVRAGMTEHAQVVAGLRLHALGQAVLDGWMIRPGIGLTWKF
ncbi:MAG TPA: hypothetical protein VFO31_26530 [Vicinamibacterales bacterium]|nr:hypothetical protein [Vicinamibacterales bacterium]